MPEIRAFTEEQGQSLRAAFETFGPLPDEDWGALAHATRLAHLEPGSILSIEGEEVIGLALILSGLIGLRYTGPKGGGRLKSICEPGQFCGDLSYLLGQHDVPVIIEAIEPSKLLFITGPTYREQLSHRPALIRALQSYSTALLQRKLERERSLLTASAEDRLNEFFATRPHLIGRIPQKTLAAFLGIAPETLSRLRAKRHRRINKSEGPTGPR